MEEEDFNDNHPEMQEGEKLLTNTSPGRTIDQIRKTFSYPGEIRIGDTAYTKGGRVIKDGVPIFVHEDEYEAWTRGDLKLEKPQEE